MKKLLIPTLLTLTLLPGDILAKKPISPSLSIYKTSSKQQINHHTQRQQLRLSHHIHKKYGISVLQSQTIVSTVFAVSRQRNLDPLLVLAIIEVESSFRTNAKSKQGAIGLMQVVPRYHRSLIQKKGGTNRLDEIKTNILVGTKILRQYQQQSPNITVALLRYNGSLGKNQKYARKVLHRQNEFRKILSRQPGI